MLISIHQPLLIKQPKARAPEERQMHFLCYLFVKNQWFEKFTKGTALGGLSPAT